MSDEKRIAELEARIVKLETMIYEAMASGRNMIAFQGKIDTIFSELEGVVTTQLKITARMEALDNDDRFIELYTNKDLKDWYNKSNLTLTDIQQWIKQTLKKEIGLPMVSKYINGEIEDLKIRHLIGKHLKHAAIKNLKAAKSAQ